MRYVPPSRRAEPSFYTLAGDPVVFATATRKVHDRAAAAERMRELAGLGPDEPLELDITAERAALVSQRPPLPPGALVLESSPVGAIGTIPTASLRLEGDELRAEAMSEQRLEQTLDIVDSDFGELVKLRDRDVTSVDEALATRRSRMRRWLDEPHQSLAGRTPREAATGSRRPEVDRLLRQIENSAERARRRGEPSIDVAALRNELGLGDELAA